MPDGNKKNAPETTYITMDPEEFNEVCKRLNQLLSSRVEKAWEKKSRRPSKRSADNHIEAAKEAFAFIHLLDLVEHMSNEIYELRQEVDTLSEMDEDDDTPPSQVFSGPQRKQYLN
jgi:hypothetical protein